MRQGAFVAALIVGMGVPVVGFGIALTQAGVRHTLGAFLSPMAPPPVAPRGSAMTGVRLPPAQAEIGGAESIELRALHAADAGAPTARAPRTSLFQGSSSPTTDPYRPPQGLHRSELSDRADPAVDRALQALATEPHSHGAMLAATKSNGRHKDEVERILRAWKLPPELAAIAFVESACIPTHSAPDGGRGLWSLPREVAHGYGLAMLDTYDERRSVALSTEATSHYLADLHERFGSWELALFAFGQGYAPALQALSNRASLDYWTLAPELPAEGTAYVAEVLAVATMLDNVSAFGLDVVRPDAPETTSDLEVPGGASFGTIARAAGTSAEHLHDLNPEYEGDVVPSTGFVMEVHLPSAGLARAKELLMPLLYSTSGSLSRDSTFDWGHPHAALDGGDGGGSVERAKPPSPVRGGDATRVFYRVQDGDTLESLAGRFGLTREAIISDNALDPSAGLRPGQLLLLRSGNDAGSHAP